MAKQFIVARGQIERGKEVLAKQGEAYKPRNAAEAKRLVDAGVLIEVGGKQQVAGNDQPKKGAESTTPGGPGDSQSGGSGEGPESGDQGGPGEGAQGNA